MTAITPGMIATSHNTPNRYYPSDEAYKYALADAMKVEYQAIVDAGIVLQLDAPDLGVLSRFDNPTLEDYRKVVAQNVEVINYAIRGLDPQMVRVHVCWGADEAPHNHDAPLEAVVELLMGLKVAAVTIVATNGPHEYEWRVWKNVKLRWGMALIPGVIDSTTNIIEHPETVAERIGV